MARIEPNRIMGQIEGDFVVFMIGMRVNKSWMAHRWWPVFMSMPRMIKELEAAGPESGFLGYMPLGTLSLVQYWRSFDHLEAYARSRDHLHWPAWVEFNRRRKMSQGDVGIWHETYLVPAGAYEAVYSGMPLQGLAKAGRLAQVTEATEAARSRLVAE